jgi:hypothetical protein
MGEMNQRHSNNPVTGSDQMLPANSTGRAGGPTVSPSRIARKMGLDNGEYLSTPDPFHFNTADMRELGKRFAIEMLMLQGITFKEVVRPGLLPVAAAK